MSGKKIKYKAAEMPLWEFFFALPYFNSIHCGIIPPIKHLNTFLMKGSFGEDKWNPFEVSNEEYETLVEQLLNPDYSITINPFYAWQKYQVDIGLANCVDYEQWQQKIKEKYQYAYNQRLAILQHEMAMATNKNKP